ncbi:MAG TPA: hypothetical protein VFS10_08480 [Pyrinomonadaceae bacterium]|nr:hypothetical protein [Pyrinomonadaceae bacterium]
MTYTRPFVTRRFVAYGGDSRRQQLSLAVEVEDAFTERPVGVPLRVFIKQLPRARTLLALSGRYCFEDIPDGDYTLVIEFDPAHDWFNLHPLKPGEWEDGFERAVKVPPPGTTDPKLRKPLVKVLLSPKPSYPFPPNATLVRGRIETKAVPPQPVAGAVVNTTYQQSDPSAPDDNNQTIPVKVETRTNAAGDYVFFFKRLPGKEQEITVIAEHDQTKVKIKEGTTQFADPLLFP